MKNIKTKLSYIWDYYKLYIIGIPLALLLLLYVISAFSSSKDIPFSIYFINQEILIEEGDTLKEALRNTASISAASEDVYIDTSLTITPEQPDFDSQMSFTASISGHTIDIMIGDDVFFNYYASMKAFADLKEFLPEDLYEALSPYIVKAENEEGLMTDFAIDLSSFSYFDGLSLHSPLLTIAKYTEHREACIAFLSMLLEYEQ